MDNQEEIRQFLTSRRERLTPEQAGIPNYGGGRRRVKGLRREEVAMLSGMSTDYYTRLERGNLSGVSEGILEALGRALQLDEAERTHLINLAVTANSSASTTHQRPRASRRAQVRVGVQRILDSISMPAYVMNGRADIVAANRMGRALFADLYERNPTGFNFARYIFLDPGSHELFPGWETVARDCVAVLRIEAGRNPYDRGLTDLVGELSTRSEDFRTWWASHDVKFHDTATKTFRHPVAGELELTGEALDLPGDPGLRLVTYTVEPNSPSEQAIGFLSNWSTESTIDTRAVNVDELSAPSDQ